jgi:16S rRNA (uracil1498-N3)-methyltransferase
MQTFYHPGFLSNNVMPEAEAHHMQHVLRMRVGDTFKITDGKGSIAIAVVETLEKKALTFSLRSDTTFEPSLQPVIRLAVAPVKSADRLEWMVEKCVEVGVSGFDLVPTQRSERLHVNLARLEKVAIAAMKQCGRCWLPDVTLHKNIESYLADAKADIKLLADLETLHAPADWRHNAHSFALFIGPEGDFTPSEKLLIQQAGFMGISLSEKVLRTETACVVAVDMVHWRKRWG